MAAIGVRPGGLSDDDLHAHPHGQRPFPVHVVDGDGLPHVELTAYACRSSQHHSPRTAYAYTGEIVAFASRAENDPVVRRQG
jgi:hypothetical protein